MGTESLVVMESVTFLVCDSLKLHCYMDEGCSECQWPFVNWRMYVVYYASMPVIARLSICPICFEHNIAGML